MGRDPKAAFERLLERVLEGMVVPFIGAGVSNGAKHRGGICGLTNTGCMRQRVMRALEARCRETSCPHRASCVVAEELRNKDLSFDKLCELWEWSCVDGNRDSYSRRGKLVFEILNIPEFANVEPADAHYYLAFLVREGVIDEVITTNYDTCIEQAYQDTFGSSEADQREAPALAIADLEGYRKNGGRKFIGDSTLKRCLKVYKINGCATGLRNGQDPRVVMLTEKDLQDWRHRGWARDLFRDRLRSRTLLFSGFGSEEPQVRYTAMQVCEEFAQRAQSTASSDATNGEQGVWNKVNAPFIAAYDPTLSFSQTQILSAFAQSFGVSPNPEDLGANAFLGLESDLRLFASESPTEKKLPADLFWKRLYQATFWRLLRRVCLPDSPVLSFLLPYLPCARALLAEAVEWFVPSKGTETACFFGRFPEMLDITQGREGVLPLVRWVERVRSSRSLLRKGWYYLLADRPVLTPLVLLLIHLLAGPTEDEPDVSWSSLRDRISDHEGTLGLGLDVSRLFGGNPVRLYVAHREVAEAVPNKLPRSDYQEISVIIQIVVNNWSARTVRVRLVDRENGTMMKVVPVRQVPLLSLLEGFSHVPAAKKGFRDRLQETVRLSDSGRRRVRMRTVPIGTGGGETGDQQWVRR
jgi:hypothetical protein